MNTNKASSPAPQSSDEDRENMIILTPASTTVSDGGSPKTGDNKNNDNTNNHLLHGDNDNDLDNDRNDRNDINHESVRAADNDNDNERDNHHDNDENGANNRFDWTASAFGRSQGLLAQVGSLSKELTELKAMIARGGPAIGVSEEQAEDLSRVKANHRSSLASLAELHRTEMSSAAVAHQDEIKRLEQAHVEEMRSARKGYGFRDELVSGLRDSYGRQIESLVLDLNEARRQLEAIKASKQPTSKSNASVGENSVKVSRSLAILLRFNDLDKAFSAPEIAIPHPGRSFQTVWEHLCSAVNNYIQTLNAAAEFFAGGPEATEVRRIRHWYQSACEKRIRFRFLHGVEGDMKDLWESELWKNENFTLQVLCTVGPWEDVPVFNDEFTPELQQEPQRLRPTGTGASRSRTPLGQVQEEQLVQVDTPRATDGFNVTAALENINRELRELEISDGLAELEDEDDENKENIEHPTIKRRVTVEEVSDEEDHFRHDPEDEGVGLAISSSPVPATPLEKEPLLSRNSSRREMGGKLPGERSYMENLLGTEAEMKTQERKTTGGSSRSDSWSFDELFSPLPADKGKGKEKMVGLHEERERNTEEKREHFGGGKPWILSDRAVKTPESLHNPDMHALKMAQQYFSQAPGGSWLGRVMEEDESEEENDKLDSDNEQAIVLEQEDTVVPEKKDRPFFSFPEDSTTSPAPPPAPEVRKSPSLPAYLKAEIESSFEGAQREEEDSDIDDNQPRDGGDLENPFADLKPGQCDTPVMGASRRSAASTTPLLRDGSPAPRGQRGGPALKLSTDHQKPARLGDPFVPMPKPPKFNLPQHKQSAPRYGSYCFRNVNREDSEKIDRWETGSDVSGTTIEGDWGSRLQRKCGRGKGSQAYTWRHNIDGEADSTRSRSISPPLPPPSRSSVTTTDRHSDFVLPAPSYPQNNMGGSSNSSNIGPMRYGSGGLRSMGPLGPAHHGMPAAFTSAQQADMAFHQQLQLKKMNELKMNELFAANYGVSRPMTNGPPSFVGGPVYAPNPPHSIPAFGNGVPIRPSFVNMSAGQGLASEGGGTWPMRPMLMQPHLVNPQTAHLWGPGGEPRRSYSTDSISPLLWKVDDALRHSEGVGLMQQQQAQQAQVQQQQQQHQQQQQQQQQQSLIPGPLMPPNQGTRPPSTMSMGLEQAAFGSASSLTSPWAAAALANAYGQPGTPGSAHGLNPGWFALQQNGQTGGPGGFEGMWTGSPMGVPSHWNGAFAG